MKFLIMLVFFFNLFMTSSDIKAEEPKSSNKMPFEYVAIDVRTPEEFKESHIKNSMNIDVLNSNFLLRIKELNKDKSYKVYCRSGSRSEKALKIMRSMGFKDVENVGSLEQATKFFNETCVENSSC